MPSRRPIVHVLTPGDHFSPSTGSAVPTVVDGLCAASGPSRRSTVVVASGTFPDRYTSADVVEFDARPPAPRAGRAVDLAAGRVGMRRPFASRAWGAALGAQRDWPASDVVAHNGPELVDLVRSPHRAVLYAHNDLFRTYGPLEARRRLSDAWRIIAVSEFLADRLRSALPAVLHDRVRVVLNGVDCDRFRPPGEPRRHDVPTVLFVGRMIPEKGPDVLLRALARLGRSDVRARFVGSYGFDPAAPLSPFEQELRRLARQVPGEVEFVPTVTRERVAAVVRAADVFAVPSRWAEPSGLTVLEGMASGLAVVASDVGGIPEQTGDAATLVRPDDAEHLAAALEAFVTDPDARLRAGAAARRHALDRSWAVSSRALDDALA